MTVGPDPQNGQCGLIFHAEVRTVPLTVPICVLFEVTYILINGYFHYNLFKITLKLLTLCIAFTP
jgi:hypothetical protein